MKTLRKKLIWGVFFAFLIISLTLIIIPFLISPDYLKQLALDQIQRTFGPHISIGRTTLSLFPHPRIEVDELVVKERPDAHAFFRTKFVRLELKIGPLFRQELVVNELRIDQPEMEVKRDQDGQWHLFNTPWAQSETALLSSLLSVEKVSISNGEITVIDESPTEGVRGFVLEEVYLSVLSQQENTLSGDIQISGRIHRPHTTRSTFNIGGQLEPKAVDLGSPSLDSSPRIPQWQFAGRINVSNFDIAEVAELFDVDLLPSPLLANTNLRSNLRIVGGSKGYDIILSDFTLQNSVAVFVGNASVAGLAAVDPTLSVTFNASPIFVETLYHTLPHHWFPPQIVAILDESNLGGVVEVIQATVTGSTRLDVGMSVVGKFRLENGFLQRTHKLPPVENLSGTVVVEPDRIKFSDFVGLYDSIPLRSANGRVLFKESGPWMEVELQGEVPGQRVLAVLSNLPSDNQLFQRLSKWKVTKGTGLLTLRFGGTLKGVRELTFQQGDYVAKDLQIEIPELTNPISNGRGRFRFSPTEISLENIQGWIGENPFHLHGNVETEKTVRFNRLILQATVEGKRFLHEWLQSPQSNGFRVDGRVPVNVIFSGPVRTPRVRGNVNLVDARLHIPQLLKKAPGIAGSIEFEGNVQWNQEAQLDRLEFLVPPVRMAGKAVIGLTSTFSVQARFDTEPIYLGLLPDGVVVGNGVLRSGILEVGFDIQGEGGDWHRWQTNGSIALTEGVMKVKGLEAPMTNIFLRLKINSDEAELQRVDFRMLESDGRLRGSVKHWKDKPEVNITFESSQFDIDLLIPKSGRSPIRDFLESLAEDGTLEGTMTMDRARYKNVPLTNVTAVMRIHDNLVIVDRIRGVSDGGPLAGRILVHLPPQKPAAVRGSFHIKDLPFEQLHQSVGHEERLVTGSLSLRGKIQGHGRNDQGVLPTLHGKLDVLIQDGHVRKGTVLPKILKILHLPAVLGSEVDLDRDGFPFDKVTSTLNIEEGIVTSEDIVVDSPIMKMTAAGTYNLKRDSIDLVSAVSPFGPYSDLMKEIPLFGQLLEGERKGLATALFSVTGSIEEPDVVYMPMSSIATGLGGFAQLALDILKNTFALPVKMLTPESEDSSDSGANRETQGTVSVDSEEVLTP